MRTSWIRGERTLTDAKGKRGGPVIKQTVVKVISPKA